jgi:hypothetical protein
MMVASFLVFLFEKENSMLIPLLSGRCYQKALITCYPAAED